jgi:glycosyltransferase involved in cell wall biosynthesis
MFTKISVLVPTRKRLERLRTLIASFYATMDGRAKLIFRVDSDDAETQVMLKDESYVVGSRLEGYKSTPIFFNELYKASDGDVLMAGNDDMVFRTPGWDRLILEKANEYPDGLFDIGVSTHNEENFPFATISRRMANAVGCFFDPRFFWGDIFWRDVASRFDRAVRLPSVEIEHDWAGFNPDRVFTAGEYTRRADHSLHHAAAVNEAVAKLKVLQEVAV